MPPLYKRGASTLSALCVVNSNKTKTGPLESVLLWERMTLRASAPVYFHLHSVHAFDPGFDIDPRGSAEARRKAHARCHPLLNKACGCVQFGSFNASLPPSASLVTSGRRVSFGAKLPTASTEPHPYTPLRKHGGGRAAKRLGGRVFDLVRTGAEGLGGYRGDPPRRPSAVTQYTHEALGGNVGQSSSSQYHGPKNPLCG